MYLCSCKSITEARVRDLLARGVTDLSALIETLGLDDPSCCGRCLRDLQEIAHPTDERRIFPLSWARVLSAGS